MRKKRISFTTQIMIAIAVLLLGVNFTLGAVLLNQSKTAMKALIRGHMLDISNTAAAMLDGDSLERLTAEDTDSAAFKQAADALGIFQNNIDLAYIYALKKADEGHFMFTVDPDPVSPGAFGEETVYTEALDSAGHGIAAVDEAPFVDRWGKFYSAYSPVFDSRGEVAGIVAVDFDATWYEAQIRKNTAAILIFSILSLLIGGAIVLILTGRLRRQFHTMYGELTSLAYDVEDLTEKIAPNRGYNEDDMVKAFEKEILNVDEKPDTDKSEPTENGDIAAVAAKVRSMQKKLRAYIAYVHEQAYMDTMTGVKNKTAYLDVVHCLDKKIREDAAAFSIAVFDINGLKEINDNYGHEHGDRIITDSAHVMQRIFPPEHLYRIGGDEFIAVLEDTDRGKVAKYFSALERELEKFNREERTYETVLAFSKGTATFTAGKDTEYREVFRRADEAMYKDKAAYYMRHGDRRKKKDPENKN